MAGTVKDIKIWILFASVFAAAIPNGVVRYVLPVIPQLIELESYDAQQLLLDYYVRLRLLLVQTNWILVQQGHGVLECVLVLIALAPL
jgi:hypothetical protein